MSVPPDMLAALQGGGGQPPMGPEAGGMPPDIMAALMGGAGAGGPAPEEVPPEGALHSGSAAEGDPEEYYMQAIDSLEMGMKADTDEGRIQTAMKAMTAVQGLLAGGEKGADGMMAGKFDQGAMRQMGASEQSY